MINTLEKFYIFRVSRLNNQINDKSTVKPNVIFDVIVRNTTIERSSAPETVNFTNITPHQMNLVEVTPIEGQKNPFK